MIYEKGLDDGYGEEKLCSSVDYLPNFLVFSLVLCISIYYFKYGGYFCIYLQLQILCVCLLRRCFKFSRGFIQSFQRNKRKLQQDMPADCQLHVTK